MSDPFEFFRQYMKEKQNTDISHGDDKRRKGWIIDYPFITFAPLIVGILAGLYALIVFLGVYSGIEGDTLHNLSKTLQDYSGLVLSINAIALPCGIVAAVLSNKKNYPIAGSIMCFIVGIPLLIIHFTAIAPFIHT
jgi:hypothetical protein